MTGNGQAAPGSWLSRGEAAVTGWSLHVPGDGLAAAVPELPAGAVAKLADGACPPQQADTVLGRKGLLNKDAATRLALCAVHRALGLEPGERRMPGPADPGTAVVASSNLGNVETVTGMVRSVRAGLQSDISPLSAPAASSNVLASAIAIWFGFGGPNLMICSGATSGADAIAVGLLLLRAGRASRVIVAGAEPADPVATAVHATRSAGTAPLRQGAACVILTTPGAGPQVRLSAGECAGLPGPADELALRPGEPPAVDLAARWGELYGAMGVAQAAVAAAVVSCGYCGQVPVICGDDADGWRTLLISKRQ